MIELVIDKIDGYNYYLNDGDKEYMINIEFYDIDKMPRVNDKIYMNRELLNEKMLNIGALNGVYGREIKDKNDKDIVVLKIDEKMIYFKKYYG